MRDIKFRGKRADIGWKYGYLTRVEKTDAWHIKTGEVIPAIVPFDEKYITYGVNAESVGEYTGLKDKNGKEIYEGDIIKAVAGYSLDDSGYIKWVNELAGFFVANDYYEDLMDLDTVGEIIGNIHENPELL